MSSVFKALSDPTRRQVLAMLRQGPRSAGELADAFDVSKPTMSAHFAVLREAGLVGSEKNGKSVTYWLNATVLEEALLAFTSALDLNMMPRRAKPPAAKPATRKS
jgi:DNA-binding transcriptional ArsR family regulator